MEYMLVIFYLFSAFYGQTRPSPVKHPITPRRFTACAMVTRTEVVEAIGRPVDGGAEETDGAVSTCDYAGSRRVVSISIQQLAAKPDLVSEIDSLGEAREISGAAERLARRAIGRL